MGRISRAPSVDSSSTMVLRVKVPKSLAKELSEKACATDLPLGSGSAPGSRSTSASMIVPRLKLQISTDFQQSEADVAICPYRAAVLGTSLHAASLLQAALSSPDPPVGGPRTDASGGRSGGTWRSPTSPFASGLQGVSAWLGTTVRPLKWAQQLAGLPLNVQSSYDSLPKGKVVDASSLPSVGMAGGTDDGQFADLAAGRSSQSRRLSDPGRAYQPPSNHALETCISTENLRSMDQSRLSHDDGIPLEASSKASLHAASPYHEPMQKLVRSTQGQLALVLFPVTGLLLVARFITQTVTHTASKIASVQIVGAGARGAAKSVHHRPARWAASRGATGAQGDVGGSGGRQPLPSLARPSAWSALPWQHAPAPPLGAASAHSGRSAPPWRWLGSGWVAGRPRLSAAASGPNTPPAVLIEETIMAASPEAVETEASQPMSWTPINQSDGHLIPEHDQTGRLAALHDRPRGALRRVSRWRSESSPDFCPALTSSVDSCPGSPFSSDVTVTLQAMMPLRRSISYQGGISIGSRFAAAKAHAEPVSPTHMSQASSRRSASAAQQSNNRHRNQNRGGSPGAILKDNGGLASTAASSRATPTMHLPASTPCLDGSLVVHNVLASVPSASPFVVLRAFTLALRRQAARQRQTWWGSMLSATFPKWQQQLDSPKRLRPAVPLVHVYNFLRGIPLWLRQVREQTPSGCP